MTTYPYPPYFTKHIEALLSAEAPAFFAALNEVPPVSVRINPLKSSIQWQNSEQVSWAQNGRYLPERPAFIFDPLLHAGTYYVQEASSMLIELAYKQINPNNLPLMALDLCAAPGGKSTHLLSLMPSTGFLVSNEVIPKRNSILQENLTKWGYGNRVVTQNQAADFSNLPGYFDLVLVDAPCSGEGLFRKDKDAIAEWSPENVQTCIVRQNNILPHAAACLKPGGYLIYSTCTYQPGENDAQVATLLKEGFKTVPLTDLPTGLAATTHGYQCYPHRIKGEGFYMAVLQKPLSDNSYTAPTPKQYRPLPAHAALTANYLQHPENFVTLEKNGNLYAIPQHGMSIFQTLSAKLYVRQTGVLLGEQKGPDFVPAHALALSVHRNPNLPTVALNEKEALTYLRCEPLKLTGASKGFCLATYNNFALGWLKVVPGRINNYYPKDWRILKQG